jgi:hypothetical protein
MKTSMKQNDTEGTKCIKHLNPKVLFVLSEMILQSLYTIQIVTKSYTMIHCKPCLCETFELCEYIKNMFNLSCLIQTPHCPLCERLICA